MNTKKPHTGSVASDKPPTPDPASKKPNENAGFYFSSFIKITDPESGEVLLQMRPD